ncbi:MAG: hypothetical protein AAB354_10715 [candidate division KSB1 bacterium]
MATNDFSSIVQDSVRLLNEIIIIYPLDANQDSLKLKVDILERIIGQIRNELKHTQNGFLPEQLLKTTIFVNDSERRIHIDLNQQNENRNATAQLEIRTSRNLQASLLVFLLLNFHRHDSVFRVIEDFVDEIRPTFSIRDFQRTKTGAIRCFTNTRFAAKQLRDFGLLKFTTEEAYKRWELSFLGILVAAQLYDQQWRDAPSHKITTVPLDGRILDALSRLQDLKIVREIFDLLCEDKDLFPAFGDMQKTFEKLAKTAEAFSSSNFKKGAHLQKAKSVASTLLSQLEKEPSVETFMKNLSTYTRIEESMQPIRQILKSLPAKH